MTSYGGYGSQTTIDRIYQLTTIDMIPSFGRNEKMDHVYIYAKTMRVLCACFHSFSFFTKYDRVVVWLAGS